MSLATVLAVFDPIHGPATLKLAELVSERLGAPVDALVINPDPREAIPMIGDAISGDIVTQVIDTAEAANQEREVVAKALFDAAPPGEAATFAAATGHESTIIAREGRAHGLTLLSCAGAAEDRGSIISAALFETGRPVLLAPLQSVETVGKRIAIFWKECPEAAKAVWASIPFLRQADEVTVFTVGDDRASETALDRIGAGLKRAGIDVKTQMLGPKASDDSARLIDAANDMDADLIIMGAYSHSRLQEFVFGGVTREILDGLARPVFLAH